MNTIYAILTCTTVFYHGTVIRSDCEPAPLMPIFSSEQACEDMLVKHNGGPLHFHSEGVVMDRQCYSRPSFSWSAVEDQ
jgi:hypothetical protein